MEQIEIRDQEITAIEEFAAKRDAMLGEIRKVGFTDKMLKEAKSLGSSEIFSPLSHTSIRSIKLL